MVLVEEAALRPQRAQAVDLEESLSVVKSTVCSEGWLAEMSVLQLTGPASFSESVGHKSQSPII